MRRGIVRVLYVAAAAVWLAACSGGKLTNLFDPQTPGTDAMASAPADDHAATEPVGSTAPAEAGLLGSDPYDDLNRGKKEFHAGNFGVAEKYFRHAVELHPRDAEAWLDLAASCDRLRRFDLADRAYAQALGILGPTAEVLNNQGYSYMLRGDYKRARAKLLEAQRKEPDNKFVANNLQLLAESSRKGKAVE